MQRPWRRNWSAPHCTCWPPSFAAIGKTNSRGPRRVASGSCRQGTRCVMCPIISCEYSYSAILNTLETLGSTWPCKPLMLSHRYFQSPKPYWGLWMALLTVHARPPNRFFGSGWRSRLFSSQKTKAGREVVSTLLFFFFFLRFYLFYF